MSGAMQFPGVRRSYYQDVAEILAKQGMKGWPASGPPKTHPLTESLVSALSRDIEACVRDQADLAELMGGLVVLISDCLRIAHMSGVPFDELWTKYIDNAIRGEPYDPAAILRSWQWVPSGISGPVVGQKITFSVPTLNVEEPGEITVVVGGKACTVKLDRVKGSIAGVLWFKDKASGVGFQFCYPREVQS
jgi:hypothetical protein